MTWAAETVGSFSWHRARQIVFSIADQACAVGGMLLANIALARTQSKEEYGVFALTYSVFTFLVGLHNAALLEPYTVYASGRYHQQFSLYSRHMWRSNARLSAGLTAALTLCWFVVSRWSQAVASHTVLGMALSSGILLTAYVVRRTFYIRRRPDLAARFSLVYLIGSATLLWLLVRSGRMNGLYAFLAVAAGWCLAGLFVIKELPEDASGSLSDLEPHYWTEHWKYSRWVLVTALVFQLTTQGYYWLAAGFLSVKEAGDLRAVYNVVTPIDQVFVAMALLIIPMMSHRYAVKRLAGLVPMWRSYCVACLVVTCAFAAVINAFGGPLMHILYAGRFDDVVPLAGTLALLPVVMGIGNTINVALKAMEKPKAVFWAYLTSGATTFIAGLPLVMHFKLRGAVYGLLASAAAYSSTLGIAFLFFAQAARHDMQIADAAGSSSE